MNQIRTADSLQLSTIAERLSHVVDITNTERKSQTKADANIKAIPIYRDQAEKAWSAFGFALDAEVDFEQCFLMLDFVEIFTIKVQAKRLFDAIDVNRKGIIGVIDFENILIAYDALDLGNSGMDLVLLDVFDSFKTVPVEKQFLREEQQQDEGKADAVEADGAKGSKATKAEKQKKDEKEEEERDSTPAGVDFSSFCEAIQMLGAKESDAEVIREAFCAGGQVSVKDVETKHLSASEFRAAFLRVADLPAELQKRRMRVESSIFGAARNRERLGRAIADVEAAYAHNLTTVLSFIDRVKQERRTRKDQRRRDQEAFRERLLHEAKRFQALRGQEKRLQLKREQEEQTKKRLESKVLKNKLLLRQQENQLQKEREIHAARERSEQLRLSEIRALGLDRLDLSVRDLRSLHAELFLAPRSGGGDPLDEVEDSSSSSVQIKWQAAQTRLSYVVFLDLSRNMLEHLPPELFYWMAACKHLKLSQNRLKDVPEDIGLYLANLQVLLLLLLTSLFSSHPIATCCPIRSSNWIVITSSGCLSPSAT